MPTSFRQEMWLLRRPSISDSFCHLADCKVCNQVREFYLVLITFQTCVWSMGLLAMCHMVTKYTVKVKYCGRWIWLLNCVVKRLIFLHLSWRLFKIWLTFLLQWICTRTHSMFQWYNSEKVNWPQNTKKEKPFKMSLRLVNWILMKYHDFKEKYSDLLK